MFSKFFQNIQETKQGGGGDSGGGGSRRSTGPPQAEAKAVHNVSKKTGDGGADGVKHGGATMATTTTPQNPAAEPRKRRRGRVKDGTQDNRRKETERATERGGGGAGSAAFDRGKRPRLYKVDEDRSKDHDRHEQKSRQQQQQQQQQNQNPHNNRQQERHQQQQRPGQHDSNQTQQFHQKRRNLHPHSQPSRPRLTPAAYELSQQLQQASKYKQLQQALHLYHNFQPQTDLDNFHACIVVDCCARCGNVDAAERIVQHYQSILLQQQQRNTGGGGDNNSSNTNNTTTASQGTAAGVVVLSVQVQTALLKAYAHAGAMHKASRLFHDIVSPHLILSPPSTASSSLRLQQQQQEQMPNVRTLNTLLRGCLWTATSSCSTSPTTTTTVVSSATASPPASTPTNSTLTALAGGVISSEEAWALYQQYSCTKSSSKDTAAKTTPSKKKKPKKKNQKDHEKSPSELIISSETSFDVSSYEASIKLLFQSLRMTPGQERLDEFMQRFGIQIKKQSRIVMTPNHTVDASTLETLGVCFLAQAQAYAWLSLLPAYKQDDNNNNKDLWLACQRAIHAVQASRNILEQAQTDDTREDAVVVGGHGNDKETTATIDDSLRTKTKKKKPPPIQGGKQAWKKESSPWTNKDNDSTTTTTVNNDDNDTTAQQQRIQEERRAASNVLYRKHRLDEIELEAKRLLIWRSQQQKVSSISTAGSNHSSSLPSQEVPSSITDFLLSKLFCFSSGGSTTTTKETLSQPSSSSRTATSIEDDSRKKKAHVDERRLLFEQQQQLLVPAWYSFGLGQLLAVQDQQAEIKGNENEKTMEDGDKRSSGSPVDATMATITTKPPSLTTKQLKHQLTCFLQKQNSKKKKATSNQQPEQRQASSCLRADGSLDLDQVFSNVATTGKKEKKGCDIDIELGSGFGDWIVPQAIGFPRRNHIAVELRADRVYSILTKACTTATSSSSDGRQKQPPLPNNICTIASEAGTFLEQRLLPHAAGRIATIFVNHPEPPTQTVGQHHDVAAAARPPRQVGVEEEAAHMLNRSTLIAAARCLIPGRGRLVIVTDNSWYARLLCNTLVQIMVDASSRNNKDKGINNSTSIPSLICATQSEMPGFHSVETVGTSNSNKDRNKSNKGSTSIPSVTLYKGQPNASIGHFTSSDGGGVDDETAPGSSYFDRLWRTGAGRHAEKTTRFVICIKRGADK